MIKISNDSLTYELSRIKDDIKLAIMTLEKKNSSKCKLELKGIVSTVELLERLLDTSIEEESDMQIVELEDIE